MASFEDKDGDGFVNPVSEVLQRSQYYPFGLQLDLPETGVLEEPGNLYLYNGKELNGDFGLAWSDYGARWYDAGIGRWHGVDPLADEFVNWSTYAYVFNNPLIFIDPDGQAPEWVPRVRNGKIQLVAEPGDNLKSFKEYFKGSSRFSDSQLESMYNNARGGVVATLLEDNYSDAFKYAKEHSSEFSEDNSDYSKDNYNCYHFCINGVWEKNIYGEDSYGPNEMYPDDDFVPVVDEFFELVPESDAIYGETIIGMNYSGGYPMHTAVYAGKDNEGKIYVMQKNGLVEKPDLVKLDDLPWTDFQFYNEKGASK